jgi:OmpA-OmpF porin, OOP family
MGKFAVAVALATTVLAGAASARDQAWYIGLEAGGFISEAKNFDLTTPAGVSERASQHL